MLKIKYLLLFFSISAYAMAQEHRDHISPLPCNPVLASKARLSQKKFHKITPPPNPPIIITHLPFLDDFSRPGPYPDPKKWQNNNVFVNYNYPTCPHTLGVATFDGVNSMGMPYNPSCPLGAFEPADTLTSQLINMGDNHTYDSIYFSFYWEAGGLGSAPQPNDTLILEFFNGTTWNEMWYQLGYSPAPPDTSFHLVMIKVADPQYFVNGFQFRFRNYATTSGNLDHWHIDEVYMAKYRSYLDQYQYDVSFVYESPSLLQNYEFMPWEQLASINDLKSNLTVFMRNNDTTNVHTSLNTQYLYNAIPGFLTGYNGGSYNDSTFITIGYVKFPPQTFPPLSFTSFTLPGPVTYPFTQILIPPSNDFDGWNDTLRFNQVFSNYYAYDDGTAEASYSIVPFSNTPASLAIQFHVNNLDTLIGVYIYYNYVLTNTRDYTFRLTLWGDGGGMPGSILYEDTAIYSPKYSDSTDGFTYYKLSHPQVISNNSNIYFGFIQTFGDSINIGWDWNDNNEYMIFYCLDGVNWNYSSYTGSVMLRPVFGNRIFNAVSEVKNNEPSSVTLYPNPARDEVYISPAMLANTTLRIYGADGKLWEENENYSGNAISTGALPPGFYIVELTPKDGKTEFQKLLISR
jgi:hypothetical protein